MEELIFKEAETHGKNEADKYESKTGYFNFLSEMEKKLNENTDRSDNGYGEK